MKPENTLNEEQQAAKSIAAAAEVERLSLQGIEAVNARDWNYQTPQAREFLNHIAADFRLHSPDSLILTWEQAVRQWRAKVEAWPDMRVVVSHVSSDVRLGEGRASVHIESHVVGAGERVSFKWLSQRLWRWEEEGEVGGEGVKGKEQGEGGKGEKEGRWVCYEMSGMRGTQSLTGFV